MNQFPYENLNDEEFEHLVISICQKILGVGCKTFSTGVDGARDSWFTGTAENYPSKAKPWSGTFNIQAKHTKTFNASCSDNDFSVNQTSTLKKEIKRLNEIIPTSPFDNYLIFTNRKLSGGTHPKIVQLLQTGIGIVNAEIIGREEIDTFLTNYPQIAYQFGFYKFLSPLRFYEKDLRDVIVIFNEKKDLLSNEAGNYLTNFTIINKEEKNEINSLGKAYFDFLLEHSIDNFKDIERFLKDPKNEQYRKMYVNTVSDLQAKITLERDKFNGFEMLIEHLIEYVVDNNEDKLRDLRKIVRVFIHFMYFNCDIGKTK